jgi:hypothetical protein
MVTNHEYVSVRLNQMFNGWLVSKDIILITYIFESQVLLIVRKLVIELLD